MNGCSIHFEFSEGRKPQNLKNHLADEKEDAAPLDTLCQEKLPYRYPEGGDAVLARLDKALG